MDDQLRREVSKSNGRGDTLDRRGKDDMATAARVHRKMRWTRLCAMTLCLAAGLGLTWFYLTPIALSRGVAAYSRGDWGEALKLAEERLASKKDDPKAWRLRARATARLGRYPAAQEFYTHLDATDLEAEDYFLLGLALQLARCIPRSAKCPESSTGCRPRSCRRTVPARCGLVPEGPVL